MDRKIAYSLGFEAGQTAVMSARFNGKPLSAADIQKGAESYNPFDDDSDWNDFRSGYIDGVDEYRVSPID